MHEDRRRAEEIADPFLRRTVKAALHLRQYLPFYVFGTIWVVTLAAFPIIRNDTGDDAGTRTAAATAAAGTGLTTGDGGGAGDATTAGTDPAATAGDGTGADPAATAGPATAAATAPTATKRTGTAAASTGTGTAPPGGNAAVSAEQAQEAIQRGTGKTRLGNDCKPDVNQMPGSTYAIPCQNVYNGPNGGATDRGVSDKEIIIVNRKFPETANSRATVEVTKQAGFADPKVTEDARNELLPYFNKTYELYGRQVKWVDYVSENGDSTDEAQSKGKEGACLDADKIVKELHAFAVYNASQPFSDCAAERHLLTFQASAYFPEKYFAKYHPYQWAIIMDCERIAYQTSEYMAKRLINRPAKFAGDVTLRTKNRKFGTYVPDNDGYQYCVDVYKSELKNKYGYKDSMSQYNYQLDISRFPDQAAQAAVQFAADGVTTVVLACDFISTVVLTAAAERQQWRPEWFTIGVGGVDLDNSARLYDQTQANGHFFGMSQLGDATKLIGPNSEAGQIYKTATNGKTIPEGTSAEYHSLVHVFNLLQAAGPVLTPANIAKGAATIPIRGAAPFPAGRWSFADTPRAEPGLDHTEVQDAREVYWVSEPGTATTGAARDGYYNGPDDKNGTFKVTHDGERFVSNAWATEEPPIYPPR